jgi:hypothetical protein
LYSNIDLYILTGSSGLLRGIVFFFPLFFGIDLRLGFMSGVSGQGSATNIRSKSFLPSTGTAMLPMIEDTEDRGERQCRAPTNAMSRLKA